jgi:hypothetical protein
LPFLKDFSTEERQLAESALSQQEERRRKAYESRGQKVGELVEDARHQLRDLLGAKKLGELHEAMKRERLAFRDLFQPPTGLDLDHRKENKARKQRIDALVGKLGTSPEKLRKIGRGFQERVRGILSASDSQVVPGFNLPKNLDKWTSLSPLNKFPLPWGALPPVDDTDPHRWFLFTPPFFGFLFRFDPTVSDNFLAERELFLDPSSGLIGNTVTLDCNDAGDSDHGSARAEAQIAFGFEAPTSGLVEVLVDAQCGIGTHDLDMEDEFGFSSSTTSQENYLMMNVLHPNVSRDSVAAMSFFSADFDDETHFHVENVIPGQHYFAQFFSAGAIPGGQSVVITVGTRSIDDSNANDVEVHSRSDFRWFISSVQVRIAP